MIELKEEREQLCILPETKESTETVISTPAKKKRKEKASKKRNSIEPKANPEKKTKVSKELVWFCFILCFKLYDFVRLPKRFEQEELLAYAY